MKPLCIDLFCGLGGWSDGFLAEGYKCIGFDIERHDYGTGGYPGQLVLADVRQLSGAQFRRATVIVASPPCQEFSYQAMPWSRAKQIAAALRGQGEFPEGYRGSRTVAELNALFDACFRIQREACEAAGRHIPMVVENVKGAQPWVGPAKANFGSFYLWGNVDQVGGRIVAGGLRLGEYLRPGRARKVNPDGTDHGQGPWFKIADSKERGSGTKVAGLDWSKFGEPGYKAEAFNGTAIKRMHEGSKNEGGSWFAIAHNTESGHGQNPDGRKVPGVNFHEYKKTGKPGRSFQSAAVDGVKQAGLSGEAWFNLGAAARGGNPRKAASAQIAKIPLPLAQYIARAFKPAVERCRMKPKEVR